jgi:transcriptional regulator with XRE-family HTH domain
MFDITPEMVAQELATPPTYAEISDLDANYALLRKTVTSAMEEHENGRVSEDEADNIIIEAIEDHADNQLDIFGLEIELVIDGDDETDGSLTSWREPQTEAQYSSAFGDVLAQLIDAEYESIEDAFADIAEVTGLSESEVAGLINGELIPDTELADKIALVFDTLQNDEVAYQNFLSMAGDPGMATMSSSDLALRAEFNAMKEEKEVATRLRQLEKWADDLYDRNYLTPAERNSLLRSPKFQEDPDSVAAFSQFCREVNSTPSEYLDRVEFCLNWKQQAGSSVEGLFGQYVTEPMADNSETKEAQEYAKSYRLRHSYS